MIRRPLLLAVVLWAVFAPLASAATSEGPRLAISVSAPGPGAEDGGPQVITVGPSGESPAVLLDDPSFSTTGDRVSWSGDGSLLALAVSGDFPDPPKAFGTGWPVAAVLRLDSGNSRPFPRVFLNGGDPVLAPDGESLVFQRVRLVKVLPGRENYLFKSSLWSLDVGDGSVKRLTRWRLAAFLEPRSFSTDGSTLLVESFGYRVEEGVAALDLRSRRQSLVARAAQEPVYSPDGTKLAFVRDKTVRFQLPKPDRPLNELWVARADGSGAKRILRAAGFISYPSWDPSGSRISFTRNPPAEATGSLEPEPGNKVMSINADGTCLTQVFSDPGVTVYGSAWRPGIGREAGPILC
jgi:Tol biopolymer transport system component